MLFYGESEASFYAPIFMRVRQFSGKMLSLSLLNTPYKIRQSQSIRSKCQTSDKKWQSRLRAADQCDEEFLFRMVYNRRCKQVKVTIRTGFKAKK